MKQNTETISNVQQRKYMLRELSEKVDQLVAIVAGAVSLGIRLGGDEEIDYAKEFAVYTSNEPNIELNAFAKLAFSLRFDINATIEKILNSDTEKV